MPDWTEYDSIFNSVPQHRDQLKSMKEQILADAVMLGEIPAPTFAEEPIVRFLKDRFTENGLDAISTDEVGNAIALLPGRTGTRSILVAAHVDKIWENGVDHTVTVAADQLKGPGVADNAMGVTALTALPKILESLGVQLDANLIFLGASRSMGRGDLEGLRFFLKHCQYPIQTGICLEGVQLGRLSYSSLGMVRGEISIESQVGTDWESWSLSGAIPCMNWIIQQILSIETPEVPKTSIILGSVQAGTTYSSPPDNALLRFEIRSEEPGMVARIRERIEEFVDQTNAEHQTRANIQIIARRRPGSIGFSHPLVKGAREVMARLGIQPTVVPSISELAALLDKDIPSLTLGITNGSNKHNFNESIEIEPMYAGFAQLVAVLQLIDKGICDGND